MALLENNTPEIIASVQEVLTEHHDLSEEFDAEVKLIQAEFKQKYKQCVAEELAQLRKKQAKMSTDLKSKLGEFDDVGNKAKDALVAQSNVGVNREKAKNTRDRKEMGVKIQAIITALHPVSNGNYGNPQGARPIATLQIAVLTQLKASYALN